MSSQRPHASQPCEYHRQTTDAFGEMKATLPSWLHRLQHPQCVLFIKPNKPFSFCLLRNPPTNLSAFLHPRPSSQDRWLLDGIRRPRRLGSRRLQGGRRKCLGSPSQRRHRPKMGRKRRRRANAGPWRRYVACLEHPFLVELSRHSSWWRRCTLWCGVGPIDDSSQHPWQGMIPSCFYPICITVMEATAWVRHHVHQNTSAEPIAGVPIALTTSQLSLSS